MTPSLSFLCIQALFGTSLTIPINFIQNASHQIYSFTNPTDINGLSTIDCNTPNCIVECMIQDSCNDITINAANTHHLNVLCDSYESCIGMKLTANNQTKVNIKCLHSHSCTHSIISTFNSFLRLQCDGASCTNTTIFIDKPLPNAINLLCTTEDSCIDLQIQTINTISFAWTDIHWINISQYTQTTNILLLCDTDGIYNVTLLYLHKTHQIQCDHDEICCPLDYIPSDSDPTSFYSTESIDVTYYELSDLFLFEYFEGYTAPLLCISLLYMICVFCWATIYFCCNTLESYNKYKSKPCDDEPMTSVCDGSRNWNKCGYFVDGLSVISDFAILTSILLYSALMAEDNKKMWCIAGYLSIAATCFGVLFYIFKLRLLTVFYPHIMLWRTEIKREYSHFSDLSETQKALKWNMISYKTGKISSCLKYVIMYDLFSASLQDSLQSVVILCVLRNYNDDIMIYRNWSKWSIFEWILRIKLLFCFILMFYKLLNGMSIECKCYLEGMDDKIKEMKPHNIVYIDSDNDRMDINEYQQYHSINECDHIESRSEVQIKYEDEELKRMELDEDIMDNKWLNTSTGAVTMNVLQSVTINQSIEMISTDQIKNGETVFDIHEDDDENDVDDDDDGENDDEKTELLSNNDIAISAYNISPNNISRKRPLSISRTKSQNSLKSEQIQRYHIICNNTQNDRETDEEDDENQNTLNEDSHYDTDPLSLDTEVIYD